MPQKFTTTACFIQEESSGGKQFRKHMSCFYAQGGNETAFSKQLTCFRNCLPPEDSSWMKQAVVVSF